MENYQSFKSLIDPFRQGIVGSPDLIWKRTTDHMSWGNGLYNYAYTKTDACVYNRNVEINFNTDALNSTSELMVAATIIHESVHAYTSYYLKSLKNEYMAEQEETISEFWLSSALELINLNNQFDLNPNYRDHLVMMTGSNIFTTMLVILKAWGGDNYTDNEYLMASMNGLNNAGQLLGQNVTTSQVDEVNQMFDSLLNSLGITQAQFNSFINGQNNKTEQNGKLPCAQ